jgi:hypothetical protein
MTEPSDKKRLSRYRPDRKAFPDLEPNERHRIILQLVYKHRFLDTELLSHLLGVMESTTRSEAQHGTRCSRRYGFGKQALYKNLQKLFNAGYLNRHFLYDLPIGRGRGSPPTVYGLGAKSARVLSETLGCSPRDIQDIVQANKLKSPFLRHALEVARFRVILELACQRSKGRVGLLFWEQGLHLRDHIFRLDANGEERRFTVCPDAMFALEVSGKGRACYMLELDRGTMPIVRSSKKTDIRSKLFGYRYYRQKKRHTKRYAYKLLHDGSVGGLIVNEAGAIIPTTDTDYAQPILGFNVLFVIPANLPSKRFPRGRIGNILSAISDMGRAFTSSSLFWLTAPSAFSIENPESMFTHCWITSNPSLGLQNLIE